MLLTLANEAPQFHPLLWGGFFVFLLFAMALDLGLTQRGKPLSTRAALGWCAVWVTLALIFNAGLAFFVGAESAEQFFAGYLLEYSLSVDNLFVFVLVFAFFRTPPHLQHRALVWGIVGAMVLRATMILLGAALIQRWQGVLVLFGLFLLYTGVMLLFHDEDDDPSDKWWIKLLERRLPLTDDYRGDRFFVREPAADGGPGKLLLTRLFLVVVIIEASDVMFALDSVPAIFGVSTPPPPAFIVFTANMFAILGLRSLYFALSGAIQQLRYLNYGLSLVLAFIGLKMIVAEAPKAARSVCELVGAAVPSWVPEHGLHLKTSHSLLVICGLLTVTIVLSLVAKAPAEEEEEAPAWGLSSRSDHELPAVDASDELGVPAEDAPLASAEEGEAGGGEGSAAVGGAS
ncbi:MAG: TerC/Alx family metal homeostasis membrane protein [Planctomycetota bacterium]